MAYRVRSLCRDISERRPLLGLSEFARCCPEKRRAAGARYGPMPAVHRVTQRHQRPEVGEVSPRVGVPARRRTERAHLGHRDRGAGRSRVDRAGDGIDLPGTGNRLAWRTAKLLAATTPPRCTGAGRAASGCRPVVGIVAGRADRVGLGAPRAPADRELVLVGRHPAATHRQPS